MELVDEAHGNEQQAAAEAELGPVQVVEVGELDRHRTAVRGRGVLVLDLRVEDPAVRELVTEVENRPQKIEAVGLVSGQTVLALVVEELEQGLAVPAYGYPLLLCVDL